MIWPSFLCNVCQIIYPVAEETMMALYSALRKAQQVTDRLPYSAAASTNEMIEKELIADTLPWEIFSKVEQAKQEWEATLDALPQLVCLVDNEGQILRANRTLEAWTLGTVTSVKGRNLHALLHPHCDAAQCTLAHFLSRTLSAHRPGEIEISDPCLQRFIQMKIQPVEDRRRLTERTNAVIIHDITQRKAAEDQLQQTNEALQRALQAKQEMLQNVSHELRTPLALILGYTHLLRDGTLGPLNDDQREALGILSQRSQYLQEMIERLLLLQTLENQPIHLIDCAVQPLIEQSVAEWKARAAERQICLTLEPSSTPIPSLRVDPKLLKQVLGNLLENAIKFSAAETTVRIATHTTADEVVIAIQDQGVGIPVHQQRQIFEYFHQLNGSSTRIFGGMGIGLALCQKIIQAHHGRLWVESAGAGQGSTFFIALASAH